MRSLIQQVPLLANNKPGLMDPTVFRKYCGMCGLAVMATIDLKATEDLYLLVDFMNRNLKDKDIIFGLSKSNQEGHYTITLYKAN